MLNISKISMHFAGSYLFNDVSFSVKENDRIGLIGRNGSGKTTLLRLIKGLDQPEVGIVAKPNNYKVGYLPQEGIVESEKNVFAEAETALVELKQLEKKIKQLSAEISERTDYESAEYHNKVQQLTDANERYSILGAGSSEAEIEKILLGLGFLREDFNRPVNEFSGGWQMRLELAKILLSRPDCILLDEPTNHLDIESIRWLEEFLKNYPGSIIIVSHDSRFLDSITNRTIELSNGKIYDMNLPFSQFVEQREILREQQWAAYKNQQKKIAQQERFIERFRYKATLASRVQSKIKQLDKMEKIEVEDEDTSSIALNFPEPPRSGRVVVDMHKLTKRYDDNLVLKDIDLTLERGEKIAFVGRNGEGKTTLSKIIAGEEDFEGEFKLGYNVEIGCYAQHQAEMLDGDSTVFEIIDNAATGEMRTQVRNLLGAFLFSGDSIYKKVRVLSGGEKSRLAIARLLLKPSNLLILDEPTNHLDMLSKNVLKDALLNFKGTLILVSHDRDFLQDLTDKTIQFKNHNIKEYTGGINEFLEKQQLDTLKQLEVSKVSKSKNKKEDNPGEAKRTREKQKEYQREESRLKRQIAQTENEIHELEHKITELEEIFSDPEFFSDIEKSKDKQKEYSRLKENLSAKMGEWTTLEEQLEELISEKQEAIKSLKEK